MYKLGPPCGCNLLVVLPAGCPSEGLKSPLLVVLWGRGDETLGDRKAPVARDKAGTARQGSKRGKGSGSPRVLAPPPSPASGEQLRALPSLWVFLGREGAHSGTLEWS